MMSFKTGPCKGCEKRHEGCHDECDSYQNWRMDYDEEKERVYRNKMNSKQLDDFRSESVKRTYRRKRRR